MNFNRHLWAHRESGFSAIESLVMLAILFLFGMVSASLLVRYQKDPNSMNFPFQPEAAPVIADPSLHGAGAGSVAPDALGGGAKLNLPNEKK